MMDVQGYLLPTSLQNLSPSICSISPSFHVIAIYSKKSLLYIFADARILSIQHPKDDKDNEDYDLCVSLHWLNGIYLTSFWHSGTFRVFNITGEMVLEVKMHSTAGVRMAWHSNEGWCQYAPNVIVAFRRDLLLTTLEAKRGKLDGTIRKWYVPGSSFAAMVPVLAMTASLFQAQRRGNGVLVIGDYPNLGFCIAESETTELHFRHLANAVASKVAQVAVQTASKWVSHYWGNNENDVSLSENRDLMTMEAEYLPLKMTLHDPRRVLTSVLVDRSGQLAVCTDTVGRVLLVDTTKHCYIRMWKGCRTAQCGWLESVDKWAGQASGQKYQDDERTDDGVLGLYLVIYTPLRGLVEIWRMRHGPLVLSLPVGPSAFIYTLFPCEEETSRTSCRTTCWLLNEPSTSTPGQVELSEVDLTDAARSAVYTHFHQNTNSEENYQMYTLLEALHDGPTLQSSGWGLLEEKVELLDTLSALKRFFTAMYDIHTVQKMLDVAFHLDCVTTLLKVTMSLSSQSIEESDKAKAFMYYLAWRKTLLQAYAMLSNESNGTFSPTSSSSVDATMDDIHLADPVFVPWLKMIHTAAPNVFASSEKQHISVLSFLEFFHPLTAMNATVVQSLPEYEEGVASESTFARLFDTLQGAVKFDVENLAPLLDFLFAPLLCDVFAVQVPTFKYCSLIGYSYL